MVILPALVYLGYFTFFSPQLCLIYFNLRFSSHCSTLDILSALLLSLVELLHWFSSRPLVIWIILPCVPLHPCRLEFLQLCSPPPRSCQPEIFTCCPSHPWQTEIFTWFSSNIYIYYLTWFYNSSHISTWDISPGSPPSHSRPGIFFLVLFLALVNMRYSTWLSSSPFSTSTHSVSIIVVNYLVNEVYSTLFSCASLSTCA